MIFIFVEVVPNPNSDLTVGNAEDDKDDDDAVAEETAAGGFVGVSFSPLFLLVGWNKFKQLKSTLMTNRKKR